MLRTQAGSMPREQRGGYFVGPCLSARRGLNGPRRASPDFHFWSCVMTYEDLRRAALAFRRKHGADKLEIILIDHGGAEGLEHVPESSWPELMTALDSDANTVAGKLARIGAAVSARRRKKD